MNRIVLWAPLASIAVLLAVFAIALLARPEGTPGDPMTGREVPSMALQPVGPDFVFFDPETIEGPYVLNIWASWCAPCRIEHPLLTELSQSGIPIHGITYADRPENSRAFLQQLGNPFTSLASDPDRRASLDLGVTGAPETFVVDGNGVIRARWRGAITETIWERHMAPAWRAASREWDAQVAS
ncbi:DsbE family thiol:disulfide interchange protein [Glycocaulis sp.]